MLRSEDHTQYIDWNQERLRQVVSHGIHAEPVSEIPRRKIAIPQTVYNSVIPHNILIFSIGTYIVKSNGIIADDVHMENIEATQSHQKPHQQNGIAIDSFIFHLILLLRFYLFREKSGFSSVRLAL